LPSSPPRAARSHSASVGRRLPAHLQWATASTQATWTTGWFSFPLRLLCGPSGCLQLAPGRYSHHVTVLQRLHSPRSTSGGGLKTTEPGTSSSFLALG